MIIYFLRIYNNNPPTPDFAKAGAAPGTTAGVELVFLSFKCFNALRQLRSAFRLPPQPSLVTALHAQPRTQKPHSHINGFLAVKQATPRPHQWGGPACRSPGVTRFKPFKRWGFLASAVVLRKGFSASAGESAGIRACVGRYVNQNGCFSGPCLATLLPSRHRKGL